VDNDGTATTCSKKKSKLLGYFYFQIQPVLGIMMEPQPTAPEKTNCWDTFTFNDSTCNWDNDGTAKPTEPTSELLGYFYSTILLVLGIMMEPHNLQHQKK
jgi:hypothetical protein